MKMAHYDTAASAGRNLRTYIDMEVQVMAEKLMANKLGAVVAIEPQNRRHHCHGQRTHL